MDKVVVQRVKDFMSANKYNIREFAKVLNMHETTLSCKLGGTRALDIITLCNILNAFPDLSAEWLLRGEGNMYKSKNREQPQSRMSFIDLLLQGLCNSDKKEVEKVKRVVDSVAELKENEE